jgi:hypothetical protein
MNFEIWMNGQVLSKLAAFFTGHWRTAAAERQRARAALGMHAEGARTAELQQAAPIPADGRGPRRQPGCNSWGERGRTPRWQGTDGAGCRRFELDGDGDGRAPNGGVRRLRRGLIQEEGGEGASDRAQPAKNERRRRFEFTGEVATSVPADGCGRARRGAWAFLGISGSGEGGQRLPAGSLVDADGVELRTGEAVALASSGTNGRRRSSGFGSSAPGGAAESLASGRRSAWRSKAPVTNYSDVAR